MTRFIWSNYFLSFVLLAQGLGHSPTIGTSRPTPGGNLKFQVPRETQPQRALSTFQSTSSISGSPGENPSVTSIGSATTAAHPACGIVIAMISFCNSISPGFTTLSFADQTPCLCYPNTTAWMPEIFDQAVTSCAHEVSAIPSEYSQFASLEGFCTRSGAGCNASSTGVCTTPSPSGILPVSFTPSASLSPTDSPGNSGGGIGIQGNNISSSST